MGWSATAGEVDNFIYEDANSVFIADEDMRKRYSLYLLYFTCFTGTKAQILTPERLQAAGDEPERVPRHDCDVSRGQRSRVLGYV